MYTGVASLYVMADIEDKVLGSLVGLAVCDAVGTAVEFMPPGSFPPVTGMQGGGKFSLLPGQVSINISRFDDLLIIMMFF